MRESRGDSTSTAETIGSQTAHYPGVALLEGAHRALRDQYAVFDLAFPNGQGDCGNYCVPMHRTAQILTQSQNSDHELNQPMFHTEYARLLSASAVFASWTCASPVVTGKLNYYWALCRHAH